MPASLWSGNLRLSLVLIPVKMYSAVSTEETISFRMIHEPSGQPIRYVKGIETEQGFKEVPEDEIVKGYEYAKGHHVLLRPEELDELRLEAKHTIDMVRFVNEPEIDSRYWEKPYYLMPEGDEADEGYVVIREALRQTRKVAIGQLIMGGRGHLVGIKAHGKGLLLSILRYANELRAHEPYFESLTSGAKADAVALAAELIEKQSQASSSQRACLINISLPCTNICTRRSSSARPRSRLPRKANPLLRSSTSWTRSRRAWRSRGERK
jgi:DNA end-binding protein Ku